MRRIFVDFEWNPVAAVYDDFKQICQNEIIEFGAVMMNEALEITGRFREYVRPEKNGVIEKRITKLTGITTEMVSESHDFKTVFYRFIDWCGDMDYEICSWSDNDILQLMDELSAKQIPDSTRTSYMLNHWRDIQEDFRIDFHMNNLTSLKRAVDMAGLSFEGKAHDALYHKVRKS